jgi:TatD DNase family protein
VLVDTHCHLGSDQFAPDLDEVLARAWEAGLGHIVVIGESPAAAGRALEIAARDLRLSATAGVHPHDAQSWTADTEAWLRAALGDPRVVAAGEMGLDYHYDHSPRAVQGEVFSRQLALATEAGKAAVIHAREADEDVIAVLGDHPRATVILHSFSSGPALLQAALENGYYVSLSGMVTFKNWGRDDVIRSIPDDRLLVETDAPYLAPVPRRGKRNEPALVRYTAEHIARVRGVSPETLIAQTGANAMRVFGPRVRG